MKAKTANKIAAKCQKISCESHKLTRENYESQIEKWVKDNIKRELAKIYGIIRNAALEKCFSAPICTLFIGIGSKHLTMQEQSKRYRLAAKIIDQLQKDGYRVTKKINADLNEQQVIIFVAHWGKGS